MAAELFDRLHDEPTFFADCCVSISLPLVTVLAERLLRTPSLVLSIGTGTGLLEQMILLKTKEALGLYGVEVQTCINKYLPSSRVHRVLGTTSLHSDAMLAESLMFVYAREPSLIALYLDECIAGALQQVIWIGPRNDWQVVEKLLLATFLELETIGQPVLPEHELLVVARNPRPKPTKSVSAWILENR